MTRPVASALKTTGGLTATSALAALLGGPVLLGIVLTLAAMVAALCWVLADTGRAERLAMLIYATRGTRQQLRSENRLVPPRPRRRISNDS